MELLNSVLVLALEYEYFLSNRTRTQVQSKVIILILKYITKVVVLRGVDPALKVWGGGTEDQFIYIYMYA